MDEQKATKKELQQLLNDYVKQGFQADSPRIKKDMCAQFADYRECAREYVVNASDAGASICILKGSRKDGIITISFIDDGCGMNKNGILDFFTIYRSKKDHPNSNAVGRHGIGKLSVAAIPGQCGFKMHTSDGNETWHAETGSLLSGEPIKIRRIKTEKQSGTTFYISFKSTSSLKKEMEAFKRILEKYVPFLPMTIQVWIPEDDTDDSEQEAWIINQRWPAYGVTHYKTYQPTLAGKEFKVTLGVGNPTHVLFQNNVMITSKYNLFSYGMEEQIIIPGLTILVDSPHFELPFGRHCLSNESILKSLSRHIRQILLPEFYAGLYELYKSGKLGECHLSNYNFELMTSALMHQDKSINSPWFFTPVFKCVNQKLLSFSELKDSVSNNKRIYIADSKLTGIDYSVFDGPVLLNEQTGHCSKILQNHFKSRMVDLNIESLIIEQPGSSRQNLNEKELDFERCLGFRPQMLKLKKKKSLFSEPSELGEVLNFSHDTNKHKGMTREIEKANIELEHIKWRVNRLVERDGVTPCETHLYLFNNQTIVLNLHNSAIKKLLKLAEVNPDLAGHWAMAMCLLDEQNILPHISAETREDLLLLDAMVRINGYSELGYPYKSSHDFYRNMMHRLGDLDLN
jgi:hypothetical protein